VTTRNPVAIPFDPVAESVGEARPLIRRTGSLGPSGVSGDGQWLALTNIGERQEDIFVSRTDGSELRRITDDPYRDRLPAWSPDGKEIAFYSNRSGRYEYWTIHPDGSGLRRISDWADGDLLWPAYSPSGDRIIANAAVDQRRAFIFDPSRPWKDQTPQPLQGLDIGENWLVPLAWSPDGRRIVGLVVERGATFSGVGVYDLGSGKARQIAENPTSSFQRLRWLPDSRRVVYVDDTGQPALLDVDTGRRRPLGLKLPSRLTPDSVAIAPDGRTIYAGEIVVESDIWLLEMEDSVAAR
jgi:Tol biopolymer transport system component